MLSLLSTIVLCNLSYAMPDRDTIQGMSRQRQGQHRRAIESFRKALKHSPKSPKIKRALMSSYATLRMCSEVFKLSDELYYGRTWNVEAALPTIHCLILSGRLAEARSLLEDELLLEPGHLALLSRSVDLAMAVEDYDEALKEARRIAVQPEGLILSMRYATEIALETGQGFEEEVALLSRFSRGPLSARLAVWQAQRWLDLGELELAEKSLLTIKNGFLHTFYVVQMGEIRRRNGRPFDAVLAVERALFVAAGPLPGRAVLLKARAYADLGRFEEANSLIASHPLQDSSKVLAARFYVAALSGDAEAEALYKKRWSGVNRNADRKLESLFPVVSGAGEQP